MGPLRHHFVGLPLTADDTTCATQGCGPQCWCVHPECGGAYMKGDRTRHIDWRRTRAASQTIDTRGGHAENQIINQQAGRFRLTGTLFTAGYAKCRGVPEFKELLADNRIDLLVDVRFQPLSRNPLWRSIGTTEQTVKMAGVLEYVHEQGLGNPDYKSDKPATRIYQPEKLPVVVEPLRKGLNVMVLCYCPTTRKCHRRLIVEQVAKELPDLTVVELERKESKRKVDPQ
jgi:hypothetical protein